MKVIADWLLRKWGSRAATIVELGSKDVNGSYKPLFTHPGWTYIGIDVEAGANVDVILKDPYRWQEIAPVSVDMIVSGQTFEHIEYIWLTILEMRRVLRPGGFIYIIAPTSGPEHRYPVDCWRIYPDGFRALAKFADLEVLNVEADWNGPVFDDNSHIWNDAHLLARRPPVSDGEAQSDPFEDIRLALWNHIGELRLRKHSDNP